MKTILFSTVLFILCIEDITAARILAIYPTPSISHQIVFRALTNELVRRGHEVTVVTTDPEYPPGQAPKNLIEIDVHNLSYTIWRDVLLKESFGDINTIYDQINVLFRTISKIFFSQIATDEIQDIINKKKGDYDLLFVELCAKPTLFFSHFFNAPVIQISSMTVYEHNLRTLGALTHPLMYPTQFRQKIYNLTNSEKLQHLYNDLRVKNVLEKIENEDSLMFKSLYGSDFPTIHELSSNVDMLYLNVNPIWMDNQPMPPNVVYIGGLHIKPPKPLPKDLQLYLDSSKHGVIYFSLGTNVKPSLLPPETIKMFIKVFSQLPYDVLWKYDKDELREKAKNIKVSKWFPQYDILGHPKVKLFIMQGGQQSTDEAIKTGVPLIGLPMLGDQWYNTEKYAHNKIGMRLNMDSINEIDFKRAIETIINDRSYRENIIRLRTLVEDQPQTPMERAIWWTEYVLRHGGAKHLKAAGTKLSMAEYLELELVSIGLIALIVFLLFLYLSLFLLYNFLKKIFCSNLKVKTT